MAEICAAGFGEDVVGELVKVVVCVGVVEAFRESEDEDTFIWDQHLHVGIGAITMVNREEDIAGMRIFVGSTRRGEGTVVSDAWLGISPND